jgi:tetratricopeptide (TPR) repeat protein
MIQEWTRCETLTRGWQLGGTPNSFVPAMDRPPLQSPADQQAHDKIRGYAFQCWLTADAWLRLQGEDRLYVECAEDFAVISIKNADIGQAKALATPISLRSADVIEAINHLWEFQQQGFPGELHFSFLTTAQVAIEKGDPFSGTGGLALWQKTAGDGDERNAERLRQFLATDKSVAEKLAPKVLAYIQTNSTKNFLEKMVTPMVWDTGHADEIGVREAVEGRLAEMAEKEFGASPMNAGNMADTLFTAAITAAESKLKVALTREGLLTKMRAHLAPQAMAVIAARQQEILGGLIAAGSGIMPQWISSEALPPIQPAADFSSRTETVASLQKRVGSCLFVVVTGSTGMGKTTLAQLFSTAAGGAWLQFRAKDDVVRAMRGVQACMAIIDQRVSSLGLIIDDLPWDKLDGGASTALRGLAFIARRRGARVIFTNQRPPTARELATAGMSDACVYSAPALSRGEIGEIALRLGCQDKALAAAWAVFVAGQTSGHPQLVHAHLIGLRARNWPRLSEAELEATGKDVQDERARRQILLADLQPSEVELLQRLTVFVTSFRRDHALGISQRMKPISNAGAAFERLRGPWIEPVTSDYYQLSPLLGKSLLEGLSEKRTKAIHTAAVKTVIGCPPVQATDVSSVLLNAIEGGDSSDASGIMCRLMMAPIEHATAVRHMLAWVIFIKTDGSPVFPDWPGVDFLFRLLQFDVASELNPKHCMEFLAHCDAIIANTTDGEGANALRGLLAFSLVKIDTPVVPIARLFWCAAVLKADVAFLESGGRKLDLDSAFSPMFQAESREDQVEVFVATRIIGDKANADRLRSLLETLEQASEEERSQYLRMISRLKGGVFLAFDRLWLDEEKKTTRTWEPLLDLFERFLARALEWKSDLFASAAARAIAIIRHEYLDDSAGATKALESIAPVDMELAAALNEQKGNIALGAKLYEEAQGLFESGIKHNFWTGLTQGNVVVCRQKAGTAAGYIPNWTASAAHFYEGSKIALAEEDYVRAFGMLADAAYAYWQGGDKPTAVIRLGEALELAPRLPEPGSDLAALRALKCFGHLVHQLAWRRFERTAADAGVILPGMCSDSRPNEKLRELPPPVVPFYWLLVLWLEFEHVPSLPHWAKIAPELRKSKRPALRCFFLELEMKRLLRSGDFDGVARCALEMADAFAVLCTLKVEHPNPIEERPEGLPGQSFGFIEPFPIPLVLLSALSLAVKERKDTVPILAAWRQAARDCLVEQELVKWIDAIVAALGGSLNEATIGLLQGQDQWLRWGHALRMLHEEKCPPEPLLAATIFFALMRWTTAQFSWLVETVRALDELCSIRWQAACENRYAFRSPTLFIPDLKSLAGNPKGTLAHLSELALAAAPAVTLRIPKEVLDEMKDRAKKDGCEIPVSSLPTTPLR